jgi:hypothetical protein
VRIYDGDTYITPEMYWATPDGLAHTRAVASTGFFDLSMWSWCGQQSENSEAQVNQYLLAMDQLGSQFPQTRFILMTGHSDGTSGGTLAHNNQMVRDYAIAHGKVLFDFEDIDTHDPDGSCYPNDADGASTWCADHPGDCANVPDSCAHSENTEAQQFTCVLKANAFWWMLARLGRLGRHVTRGLSCYLHNPMLHRIPEDVQLVVETEFVHHISAVHLDRARTQHQPVSNLGRCVSFRNQPQHLSLPSGELVMGIPGVAPALLQVDVDGSL